MSKATRATKMLEQAAIAFTVHAYDYDPHADSIGLQAAESLDEEPARVLKTLMALVDGKPVCVNHSFRPRGFDETARFRISAACRRR